MDGSGRHMATSGADGQLKVWDLRMLKPLHAYLCVRPASSLDISQRGMLAVGFDRRIQVRVTATHHQSCTPNLTCSTLRLPSRVSFISFHVPNRLLCVHSGVYRKLLRQRTGVSLSVWTRMCEFLLVKGLHFYIYGSAGTPCQCNGGDNGSVVC